MSRRKKEEREKSQDEARLPKNKVHVTGTAAPSADQNEQERKGSGKE